MVQYRLNYCLDCDWSASTEDYTNGELIRGIIDHMADYNHQVIARPVQGEPKPAVVPTDDGEQAGRHSPFP
jgi:hypothetical protein